MEVDPNIKPGVYLGIPNDAYHAGPGISKSGLWTIHTQTPAHYKFPPPKDDESTTAKANKDFGTAAHIAILEPEDFEKRVMRGPEDRRGNKWTDAVDYCKSEGKTLLIASAYDEVLAIRDAVHANSYINGIMTGGKRMVEASAYWTDPVTGRRCRCRPDLWRDDLGVMLDLKTATSAHPDPFSRAVINYGYHAQEAFYSDGWDQAFADGAPISRGVAGFLFLAWEKKSPYACALYELPPSIVEEGRVIMRKALDRYHECETAGEWPGYASGVQELSFKRWHYTEIDAPDALDSEAA